MRFLLSQILLSLGGLCALLAFCKVVYFVNEETVRQYIRVYVLVLNNSSFKTKAKDYYFTNWDSSIQQS